MNQQEKQEANKADALTDLLVADEQADEIKGGEIKEAIKNGSIVLYDQTHSE